jgi:hypothetical protein
MEAKVLEHEHFFEQIYKAKKKKEFLQIFEAIFPIFICEGFFKYKDITNAE